MKDKSWIKLDTTLSTLVTTPDVGCLGKANLPHNSVNLVDYKIFLSITSFIDCPFVNSNNFFKLSTLVRNTFWRGVDLSDFLTISVGAPVPYKYDVQYINLRPLWWPTTYLSSTSLVISPTWWTLHSQKTTMLQL